MRDVSQTTSAAPLAGATPATEHVATLLEARYKLAHALQTSLYEREILGLFYRHLQGILPVAGCSWQRAEGGTITLGERATHRCHYNLNLPDHYLGEISFYRRQRFNEQEQQTLETLLASLAFPLRNARQYHHALKLALVDPLTGVGNRSALDNTLANEHERLKRYNQQFALVMVDIDNFKRINDEYGHAHGDEVIRQVAQTIEQISRGTDKTFRYGGEEFTLLLSNTGAAGGLITAERLRRAVEALAITTNDGAVKTTVSIGVSACMDKREPTDHLFNRADNALYQAKRQGRNRVCCESPPPPNS